MARRSIQDKKIARLRKMLRSRPPAFINLVEYLQDRKYADTAGKARQLLTDGKVRHESHIVGRKQQRVKDAAGKSRDVWVAQPLVPASYRDTLVVLP